MKIEKLNDDKIRITLNMEDLQENDIDFQSFMSNSIESQELFLSMLDKAEKEVGFQTDNYKIMIEALATSGGNFVFTVTRVAPEKKSTYKVKNLNIKRKTSTINRNKAVYCFNSFDEFCAFCTFLNNNILQFVNSTIDNSSLFEYKSRYYLVLSNIKANVDLLKSFCSSIVEFATYVDNSDLFESKLLEYGKPIMKDNAIADCIKHFS